MSRAAHAAGLCLLFVASQAAAQAPAPAPGYGYNYGYPASVAPSRTRSTTEISALYVITLVASGLALVVNAGALTIRSTGRSSLLPMGLAVVVGLSLALLFALSGPWDGGLIVSGQALDTVVGDLRGGFFHG